MSEFILYSYYRSSASHRVRIALNLKQIPYEYRAVHLVQNGGEQNQASYLSMNPSGQVPTLVHNDRALGQSVAIVDYLDAIHPEPRLFPQDPFQKALVLQACEIINSGIQPLQNLKVLNELEKRAAFDQKLKADWAASFIRDGLKALEKFLKPHAGAYCFGNAITAADAFLVPQYSASMRFHVSMDEFPLILKIVRNCMQLEAFQKAAPEAQTDAPKG